MSSRGPSLPPRVIGEVIGTLTIRFLACSTIDTYARVQFWGESGFSCIVPLNNESVDGASHAIEYPLVGNILAINSYLTDASPLQVSFLRRTKGCDGSLLGPELVGGAYIRDMCINNLPHLDSAKCDKANMLKTTVLRRLKMMRPGSDTVIGEAIFELDFELFADVVLAAPIASSLKASLPDSPNNSIWRMQQENPPVRIEPCVHVQNFTRQQLVSDDAMREQSDVLCGSSTAEQKRILEELLDLCNDDMTIPTVDSAVHTTVDPYDIWISRIVADANSPPAKEFPCLVSAGPNKSSALRKVGILKLDVDSMTLMAKVANKVKNKVLHLQFNSRAFTPELHTDVNLVEIRLREQPGEQYKTLAKPGRRSVKIKPIGTDNDVIFHRIDHAKQIEVEFSDDESIRRWLDGTLEFSLFCHALNRTSHPKLPRVAMLAGKAKSTIPSSVGEVFLAKSCFRLCDVILSETLSVTVKLDLVTTKDHIGGDVVGVNTVIGTLSINLGLYPKESPDCCVPRNETTESQGLGTGNKYEGASGNAPHDSSLASTLHPMSVLLSYFAGTKVSDCVTEPSSAVENSSPRQVRGVENAECGGKDDLPLSNVYDQNGLLNSVTTPYDWLWVRVERISRSLLDVINERENGCLKLDMSCTNHQFIQHGQVHPFSSDNLVHESFIVRSYDDSAVPMNSICLWQFPLTTEYTLDDDSALVLQLSHCHTTAGHASGSSERRLVGLAKIPFALKPAGSSRIQSCNWLPDVVAQGSFDVLDPKTSTLIGNLEVAIAHGTLQQINGFSTAYRSILTIQRWWKRSRTDNKHKEAGNNRQFLGEIEPESPEKERPLNHEDCSREFDTIHGAFIATFDRARRRESDSSPDSLFEEWSQSQQSITASKSGVENALGTVGSSTGDIPLGDDDSMDSLRSNKTDAFQTLHAVLDRCLSTREIGIAHSSVGGLSNTSTLERGTLGCECTGREEWHMHPHLSSINSRTNLCHSTENERRSYINMSCLKPTKLEDSFSKGQDDEIRPSTSIDPPEEIKQVSKRKAAIVTDCLSTAHDHPGNRKRHRLIENPNELQFSCPLVLVHDERERVVHYATSRAESSCAYENCVHADEDVDETMSYRSLTSVLGTLDRINSIFTCGEVLQSRCRAADDTANCLSEVAHHDVPDVNKIIDDEDLRCRHIERPDPGRHAEPPEENNFTLLTPRRNQKEPPNDAFMDTIQTCDRGNSPMRVLANHLVNASTSPPNNIDMDEAIGNGIGSTHSFGIGKEQHCNDIERHQSADNYDDIMAKGNDHESEEQPEQEKLAHAEVPTRRLNQQSQLQFKDRYVATNRASRSEVLNKNKPWQFMMHPRRSALPHRLLGEESRGSLSPQLKCTDPPRRFCYLPRDQSRIRSSNIEVGASAKLLAEKMGALTFDIERLERIFQS